MNIVVYPNAKINLGLQIIGKRADGFHDLETLFVPIFSYTDILEIVESRSLSIKHSGIQYHSSVEDLCLRAYKLIKSDYSLPPVSIYLHKQIPVGSGLGGGSSDAAFTLKALNEMFSLGISKEKMFQYASSLGSDCPFFLLNSPAIGKEKGNILTQYDSVVVSRLISKDSEYEIKIVPSNISVSTKDAYKNVRFGNHIPLEKVLDKPIELWKDSLFNDFEATVFAQHPSLLKAKEELYKDGALYASMSGSGSALYGIFRKKA